MLQLYFKKLLLTLVFLILYFVVFMTVIAFVWMRLAPSLQSFLGVTFHANLHYCIILAISLILELLGVYFLRVDNPKYKEAYKKINDHKNYSFRKDFVHTLKSAENTLHTCAYLTLAVLFTFYIVFANTTPILPLILGTVIAILLFAAINTLHWCIVHKTWLYSKE